MLKIQGTADGLRSLRLSKKSRDFSDSLPNVSIFGPLCGPKICRCAAQTPAGAGLLQTFDPIRGGLRPLELPFLKVISVKRGFFDTLKGPQIPCGLLKFRGFTRPALPPARPSDPRSRACPAGRTCSTCRPPRRADRRDSRPAGSRTGRRRTRRSRSAGPGSRRCGRRPPR